MLEWGSKWTWNQWWGRIHLFFYLRDRNWHGFSVRIALDFFLCGGQNWSGLCSGRNFLGFPLWIEIDVVFRTGIEIDLVFECVPKRLVFSVGINWLCFCAGGRNWLGFCMMAENRSVLAWASNLTSSLCGLSKLTWLCCGGSNSTWFRCRDKNWLGFDVGFENDLVLVFGSKLTWF